MTFSKSTARSLDLVDPKTLAFCEQQLAAAFHLPQPPTPPMDIQVNDLAGQRYGRLLVLSYAGTGKDGHPSWRCRCDCGSERVVSRSNLKSGNTQSCGCLRRQQCRERSTHGMEGTPEYDSYINAKQRCENPHDTSFANYGGRGIRFEFKSFEEFFAELGPRPKGLTLDRIHNDGNYRPGNVRWATRSQQARNQRPRISARSKTTGQFTHPTAPQG